MGLLEAIGTAAHGFNAAKDEEERLRKLAFDEADAAIARAKKKSEGLQDAAKGLMLAGQNKEAAKLVPGIRSAFNEAYGQNLPTPEILGEPVMARGQEFVEQQGPPTTPGGKVGLMAPTPYTYDTGERNFDNPRTTAGIRAGAMLGAAEPSKNEFFNLSPGEVRYKLGPDGKAVQVAAADPRPAAGARPVQNPVTGEWFIPAPGMKTDVKPEGAGRLVQNPVTGEWFTPAAGMTTTPPPRMVAVTNPDGSVVYAPATPGETKPIKPPPRPPEFDMAKAAEDAKTIFPNDKKRGTAAGPLTLNKRKKYIEEQQAKAEKALAEWTKKYGGGGGNPNQPGSSKAARADRGILNIAPPIKWEDTQLLPHWEERAKAVLSLAPGVEISSRARSVERNAQAGKRGGAPNSWHTHRQAFDVVKYTPAQKEKLRAWAASEGIHMLDEGDHLHFQPLRTSAADDPKLAAFYQRHGIAPQEA